MKVHPIRTLLPACAVLCGFVVCSCSQPKTAKGTPNNVVVVNGKTVEVKPYTEISLKCQGQRVPVIMYHDVISKRGKGSVWFDTTEAEFEQQMEWIAQQNIKPISLDQLYRHLTTGEAIPDKSIVLTFDDNYQGFNNVAMPILERYRFPAAMFVHTKYVGDKNGSHPKMDWPTLKTLVKNPLITIGSHTVSHPDDITQLSPSEQLKELTDSKATLEKELGKPMPYLAYPDGKNDKLVQENAKAAGYTMAFTMANSPAEESPNIMAVGRYIQTKIEKGWEETETALKGGAIGVYSGALKDGPVTFREGSFAGTKLALVIGGKPQSLLSPAREGVLDFIHRTPGAVAGINGGFFAMAAIQSSDNQMVGPCKVHDAPTLIPDHFEEIWPKLHNRPVVMWGPTSLGIVPFEPGTVNSEEAFRDYMPDYTDAFLAGVWLVHGGIARNAEDMDEFASKDIEDPRRRAFMGIDAEGHMVLGASTESASSEKLAKAAAAAGIQEAVLLDSGFSTSLVYGEDVKASGHSTDTIPSRPVPHAIVLLGTLDPTTAALGTSTFKPGQVPTSDEPPKKHRRRRKKTEDELG